jgi:membrane protease subunit (stomatin/prohibitin family)
LVTYIKEDEALLIDEGTSLLYLFDPKYHPIKTIGISSFRLDQRSQDIINMSADHD